MQDINNKENEGGSVGDIYGNSRLPAQFFHNLKLPFPNKVY